MANGKMRYGILGEDHSTTAEKLAKYTGEVAWGYLRDHYRNGVLFFVDPALKLETVGLALAEDDSSQVAAWLKSGEMVKIEKLHAEQWEGTDQPFEALVVSPFVLCRPLT
jgi:hypothetical protein